MKKLVFIMLAATSCRQKSDEQKYLDYINDPEHKIVQQIEIGGVTTTMKYIPDEYRNAMNRQNEAAMVDSINGYYYFNMKMEKLSGDKPLKEKLLYMNFDIQRDFVLLVENDSIPASICQKIENGRAGSYEYMLAFEKDVEPGNKDLTVFYNDKVFGMGTVAFVYNYDDIKKIPALKPKID